MELLLVMLRDSVRTSWHMSPKFLGSFVVLTFLSVSAIRADQAPKPATPPRPGSSVPAPKPAATPALTNGDIVNMVAAGLPESIVVGSIRDAKARSFDITPNGLIALKKAGVSDGIIAVMMDPTAVRTTAAASPALPVVPLPAAKSLARDIKVGDGTEVKLRLVRAMSSANAKVEDRVDFEVTEDIKVDGTTVISKGALANGRVTEAQSRKSFGRSGKLNFSIDSVKAVDGQGVRLRATRESKGGDSFGKAGVVTILAGPFGALVRGKEVEIPAGTDYTIYIDGDRTIQLKPAP